jgi:predicted SpoU family rRNA methylase
MKQFFSVVILLLSAVGVCAQKNTQSGFIENKGQIVDQNGNQRTDVLFNSSKRNFSLLLRKTGFSYQLFRNDTVNNKNAFVVKGGKTIYSPASFTVNRIDVELEGCNSNPEINKGNPSDDILNFYTGGKVSGICGVHQYGEITYKNIYPGIDLVFRPDNSENEITSAKYDFIIHPGADISLIKLRYLGAKELFLEDGMLKIKTNLETLTEKIPLAYFESASGVKNPVECHFNLKGNLISYQMENNSFSSLLIIDPTISRLWGTYYGNNDYDTFWSIKTDSSDNIYACGHAGSLSVNLATVGAYQVTSAGSFDGLLAKFDSTGNRLWATYYGGNQMDYFLSMCIDKDGNLLLNGYTRSTSGIATPGSFQPVFSGGTNDGFIVKFSSQGTRIWATYFGGTGDEYFTDITTDSLDNIYTDGYTTSTDSIATVGSFQQTFGGNTYDGFIEKFDSAGVRIWGTYFGGTGNDYANAIAIDSGATILVGGKSSSTSGIATAGSYQPTNAGFSDGYIARFDSSGNRIWCTYYGGTAADGIEDLSLDQQRNIIMAGSTTSYNGIASPGAFQTVGYGADAFILKMTSSGNRIWATYYGDQQPDNANAITTNSQDDIILFGESMSPNGIATGGTWQDVHGYYNNSNASDNFDGFIVKFTNTGQRLWCTYYGGDLEDGDHSVAVDSKQRIIIAGFTASTTNISSPGAFQTSLNALQDAMLVRFDEMSITTGPVNSPFCASTSFPVSFSANGFFGPTETFIAQLSNASGSFSNPVTIGSITGQTSGNINVTIPVNTPSGINYRIRVKSVDRNVSDADNGANLTIYPIPVVTLQLFPVICEDAPVIPLSQVSPGGQPAGGTYSGPGVDVNGNFDASVAGVGSHIISYTYTDAHQCSTQVVTTTVIVNSIVNVTFNPIPPVCDSTPAFQLTQAQPAGGTYFGTGVINNFFDPTTSGPGTFSIFYIYTNGGCVDTAQQTITVFPAPIAPVVTFSAGLFTSTSAFSYQWYKNSIIIFGATNQTLSPTGNGSYYVVITDTNGCTAQSVPIIYNGIPQLSPIQYIEVLPNPFSQSVNLHYEVETTSSISIKLFDPVGKEITVILPEQNQTPGVYEIDGIGKENLASGIYFVEFTIDHQRQSIKVVKE